MPKTIDILVKIVHPINLILLGLLFYYGILFYQEYRIFNQDWGIVQKCWRTEVYLFKNKTRIEEITIEERQLINQCYLQKIPLERLDKCGDDYRWRYKIPDSTKVPLLLSLIIEHNATSLLLILAIQIYRSYFPQGSITAKDRFCIFVYEELSPQSKVYQCHHCLHIFTASLFEEWILEQPHCPFCQGDKFCLGQLS